MCFIEIRTEKLKEILQGTFPKNKDQRGLMVILRQWGIAYICLLPGGRSSLEAAFAFTYSCEFTLAFAFTLLLLFYFSSTSGSSSSSTTTCSSSSVLSSSSSHISSSSKVDLAHTLLAGDSLLVLGVSVLWGSGTYSGSRITYNDGLAAGLLVKHRPGILPRKNKFIKLSHWQKFYNRLALIFNQQIMSKESKHLDIKTIKKFNIFPPRTLILQNKVGKGLSPSKYSLVYRKSDQKWLQ